MKHIYKLFMMAAFLLTAAGVMAQGTTTAGINGKITDKNGAALTGATVLVVEDNTGAQYGTISDDKGFFRLPNMNPGGPYKFTVTFVGFQTYTQTGVFLNLGQTLKIDVNLAEASTTLKDVEIVGVRNDIFDGNRTGTQTNVSAESMNRMPSIGRNITDFTRLTPQAKVTTNGGLEVGGMNNRYNAIFIDGAVNNDVFGLAESGTNGGQTGISPFSMDIIDQFTISIAPYDIKQGGFAGAGINAVTRRGTNEFSGSAYYFMRNEGIAGKTPTDIEDAERNKLADFSSNTYGFRLGGPIIKDKLFFFANAEIQQDETPQPFEFESYGGDVTTEELDGLTNFIKNTYGYDPGSYTGGIRTLDGVKLFARIDWNISQKHKLTLRHQYTKSELITPGAPSSTNLVFSNAGIAFPSTTNSTALEVKSIFNNTYSNDLIIGLTFVRDDRDPMSANFPYVRIKDGTRNNIYFGSEEFSTANYLSQDIITLTDNFAIYKGKHTFTIGTHNEFYSMYNLFVRQNFGSYQFDNLNAFLSGAPAYQFDRSFSVVDDVTGDGSAAAADFNAMQIGLYGQWEYEWSDRFNTTVGLRFDVPMFLKQPPVNDDFNENMVPLIEGAGLDLEGAKTGQMPDPQVMVSPRIGFNWDVTGEKTTQVRGGIGIFTSRIPFVWPGGSYTNNGVTTGGMRLTLDTANIDDRLYFNPDWENQPSVEPTSPSGQVDLFAKDFKFPQVLRGSLAVDQKLPWGIVGTAEFVYTKTLNNVLYYNYRYIPTGNLTGTGDDRPIYSRLDINGAKYTDFIFGTNTNEGYSYNFTVQARKEDYYGFSAFLAYTYGRTMSMNDGVSSQNSSQWRVPNVRGKNDLDLAISDFDLGSRVVAFLSYKVEYAKFLATTVGLYYNGQSGPRYAYGYADGSTKFLGEDNQSLELMYVPENETDIYLIDKTNADGSTLTAAQQWADLDAFIENDEYLTERRGEYAERNHSRAPFSNIIDLHFAQDFYIDVNGKRNTLQLTFDIFNLTNMLNSDWGRMYYVSGYYNVYPLVKFEGFQEDNTTPQFSFTKPKGDNIWSIDDAGLVSSRWQGQIGIRYIFN